MLTLRNRLNRFLTRGVSLVLLASVIYVCPAGIARADTPREFRPIDRGELYEREFLDDFFAALGYRPEGRTWVDESETVRLLVMAGSQAVRGDADDAISTLDLLPDPITSAFPFLATMREDLLVPEVLEPWYEFEEARTMIFRFYEDAWLPHPEYRDDYITFRDDTIGRASRTDPAVPAVWIRGHLSDYGFVPDQTLSQDDPYLFLWDLLTGITYYAQRSSYYGVQWDRYDSGDYKRAVLMKFGETIKTAYDESARQELGRTFWGSLIDSYHPFEPPTEAVESTGEMEQPSIFEVTSRDVPDGIPPTGAADMATEQDRPDTAELFRPPPGLTPEQREAELLSRIEALETRVHEAVEVIPPEVTPPEVIPPEVTPPEITEPDEVVPDETVSPEEIEPVPDEFTVVFDEPTPSEAEPEPAPAGELGNYALVRLNEIADQLAVDIGSLAADLGRETIDLVMLYNDRNVSDETISNAEDRYIARREAFLAGLGVWDRFDMEIYTPLALRDFNDLVVADLRTPYEDLKSRTEWATMYSEWEEDFEEAFQQIADGVRNRRDEPDIEAAEAAALATFMADYNDLIKEIEDLLAGAIVEPSEGE